MNARIKFSESSKYITSVRRNYVLQVSSEQLTVKRFPTRGTEWRNLNWKVWRKVKVKCYFHYATILKTDLLIFLHDLDKMFWNVFIKVKLWDSLLVVIYVIDCYEGNEWKITVVWCWILIFKNFSALVNTLTILEKRNQIIRWV